VPRPPSRAKALWQFELPAIDDYDFCLHLACDDERRLADIEAALTHGAPLASADGPLDPSTALIWRETRTGFTGAGLPAGRQDTGGIPAGRPVPSSAPLFIDFRSGLRKNQATEDDVTISSGQSLAPPRYTSVTCACALTAGTASCQSASASRECTHRT
jgi:dye decolorizing peroxidase